MDAFQFFFQASAGIATGIAIVILPALFLVNRFAGRRARG